MKKILSYVITAVLGLVVALLVLLGRGTFSQTDTFVIYKDLCDAFFIPGIIFFGFGLLVFASNGGAFDMLRFGLIKFFNLFKRDLTKVKYRTYNDYKKAVSDKKRNFAFIMIVGIVLLALSIIFVFLYEYA